MLRTNSAIMEWSRRTVPPETFTMNPGGASLTVGADELIVVEYVRVTGTLTAGNTAGRMEVLVVNNRGLGIKGHSVLHPGSGNAADTPDLAIDINEPFILEPGDVMASSEGATMAAGSAGAASIRRVPRSVAMQNLGYIPGAGY